MIFVTVYVVVCCVVVDWLGLVWVVLSVLPCLVLFSSVCLLWWCGCGVVVVVVVVWCGVVWCCCLCLPGFVSLVYYPGV